LRHVSDAKGRLKRQILKHGQRWRLGVRMRCLNTVGDSILSNVLKQEYLQNSLLYGHFKW